MLIKISKNLLSSIKEKKNVYQSGSHKCRSIAL